MGAIPGGVPSTRAELANRGVNLLALALALRLGFIVRFWAISGVMIFATIIALYRRHLPDSRLKTLRLITSKRNQGVRAPNSRRNNARLNGGRFGYGYAWLVYQCTAVLPQARVPNRNSTRTSTAEAHALKLLATQRGNVRSNNIATDNRGTFGPTTVQVPR